MHGPTRPIYSGQVQGRWADLHEGINLMILSTEHSYNNSQFYSYPQFFGEQWRALMEREQEEKKKKKSKKDEKRQSAHRLSVPTIKEDVAGSVVSLSQAAAPMTPVSPPKADLPTLTRSRTQAEELRNLPRKSATFDPATFQQFASNNDSPVQKQQQQLEPQQQQAYGSPIVGSPYLSDANRPVSVLSMPRNRPPPPPSSMSPTSPKSVKTESPISRRISAQLSPTASVPPPPPPPPPPASNALLQSSPTSANFSAPPPAPPPPPAGGIMPIAPMESVKTTTSQKANEKQVNYATSPSKPSSEQLQQQFTQLKKAVVQQASPKPQDARTEMLSAIKGGTFNLKKVTVKQKAMAAGSYGTKGNDVATVLARRAALEVSDSEDSDSGMSFYVVLYFN